MKPTTRTRWMAIIAYFAVLPTLMASEESVARAPDATNGMSLVRSLCINCHAINDTAQYTVPAGVPTFREIANRPGQTIQSIYATLILPHYPMPDTRLTEAEMHDIVAYINGLRTDKGRPKLLPARPKKKDKPDRPATS